MKPRAIDLDPRAVEAGDRGVRPAADGDQHAVERLLLRAIGEALALESDRNALARLLHRHDFRVEEHGLAHLLDALGEHVDEIAVGARQQPAGHLDDGDPGPERGIDAPELEPDVAAANYKERLRDVGQLQRPGRIHQPRTLDRQTGHRGGTRAGRDDGVVERDRGDLAAVVGDLERLRIAERRRAAHVGDLPLLGELPETAGQLVDDLLLEAPQAVEVDGRGPERDAPGLGVLRLLQQLGDVQQRLRRDAAAIEADAAGILARIDERDAHAEIGRVKRRGVPARAAADDNYV